MLIIEFAPWTSRVRHNWKSNECQIKQNKSQPKIRDQKSFEVKARFCEFSPLQVL